VKGRVWKKISIPMAEKIKKYLINMGGEVRETKGKAEIWRVRLSDATFTYYKNGTIYSTPTKVEGSVAYKAWKYIDSLVGSRYREPTKDFLIGLDETGKGELIGHTILTGVIFPKQYFEQIDLIVGPADTKRRHSFNYWDELYRKLDNFRKYGLYFITDKIPPWQVDRYNLNKIMDVTYQRILNIFFRKADISKCRIILDDYGIGDNLRQFFHFLERNGAEVIVTYNAEETYLEAKVASLISKREREAIMMAIKNNPDFIINGHSIGSGNAADVQTRKWLNAWYRSGRPWPWFVKRSFKTVREIKGIKTSVRKEIPPIDVNLLSPRFLEAFNKGNLSIQALSLVCSYCGSILKSAKVAIFKKNNRKVSCLKCPKCDNIIENAGITLRYYCGYILPDSSAIRRGVLTKDLELSRLFENFTVILSPVVRKECDGTPRGKKEFEKLAYFSSMGRIRLESIGRVSEISDDLSNSERDEKIIDDCLEFNAILLTADKSMYAFALSKGVFTIFVGS